jgi:hypothetical protein
MLVAGSVGIKGLTHSKRKPDEKVSSDGVHVGLASYLWDPKADMLKLDVGPPRLGRANTKYVY